jgi:hypothetical protein
LRDIELLVGAGDIAAGMGAAVRVFLDPIVLPALIWARVAAQRDHGVIHNDAARSSSFLGGTNMTHVHALTGAESTPGPLVIRTIGVMDI